MKILEDKINQFKDRFEKTKVLWIFVWILSAGYGLVYLLYIKARLANKLSYEKSPVWVLLALIGFAAIVLAAPAAVLFGKAVDKKLAAHHWPCFSVLAGLTVWIALNIVAMTFLDYSVPHKQFESNTPTPTTTTQSYSTSAPTSPPQAPPH